MQDMQNVGTKKKFYKRWWFWVIVIFLAIIIGSSSSSQQTTPVATNTQPQAQNTSTASSTTQSKESAQKELDDVMATAKKAGLVTSYDFSETANIVYVSDLWYSQGVQFKKDFMGKIATLKEAITGYHRFEVRHYQSNEKVGEVTAFSGSIEVYK